MPGGRERTEKPEEDKERERGRESALCGCDKETSFCTLRPGPWAAVSLG